MHSYSVRTIPDRLESANLQDSHLKWYFAFFIISGFCGLIYEVVWVRLAMASFGVTTALVSIVLSIFMAGLGLGSWGVGVLTRKISGPNAPRMLRFYSLAELLIGCSALLVPIELKFGRQIMLHMGSVGAWQTSRYYILAGVLISITLLPWCTFLGSTFPLLMSVIRQTCHSASSRSFSYLYLANVVGALLGTLLSAFVLIELLGFQSTLWFAASFNAILALLALRISFRLGVSPLAQGKAPILVRQTSLYGRPRSTILVLLFTTGLISMGSEVIWMRQFTPFLGNFVYAFALVLGAYLLATVMGARDYRSWSRTHRPDESAATWSVLAASALIPLLGANPLLKISDSGMNGLRIVSIMFFCALTGFLTPLLVDVWSAGEPDEAGLAYAFNVLGCIVGPLIASFWLEPWLGERKSILALSLPLFGFAAVLAFQRSRQADRVLTRGRPRSKFVIAVAVSVLLFSFSNDYETVFPKHEVRRDYAATVIAAGTGWDRTLLVNGFGMTFLTPITKYIVHLPMASMERRPHNGLVICFGMGTSFRSMLSWGIPTTTVDLIPSVPKLFSYYHADAPQLISSPLARIVVDDGRRFLDGSNQMYDVIVVDPPPPVAAPGSSLLYSREFYEVIKRHLNPDGIFQNWYPSQVGDAATTASITKTLMQSFPYVRAFRSYDKTFGIHYLASMRPLPKVPGSVLAARMPQSASSDFVEWGPQASADKQFDAVLSQEIPLQELVQEDSQVPALTDDRPINEYFLLRKWFNTSR
jgi:predicted membrane-bound spermidine synthase